MPVLGLLQGPAAVVQPPVLLRRPRPRGARAEDPVPECLQLRGVRGAALQPGPLLGELPGELGGERLRALGREAQAREALLERGALAQPREAPRLRGPQGLLRGQALRLPGLDPALQGLRVRAERGRVLLQQQLLPRVALLAPLQLAPLGVQGRELRLRGLDKVQVRVDLRLQVPRLRAERPQLPAVLLPHLAQLLRRDVRAAGRVRELPAALDQLVRTLPPLSVALRPVAQLVSLQSVEGSALRLHGVSCRPALTHELLVILG
mmetsp:Transcript_57334/g.167824  ORF Transcript_57334/g.167824 Transcript_57334/m.167824 type:complete len:264 (+) Transcript_57334:1537-2328(+)